MRIICDKEKFQDDPLASMIGDINFFMAANGDETTAEINIMIVGTL